MKRVLVSKREVENELTEFPLFFDDSEFETFDSCWCQIILKYYATWLTWFSMENYDVKHFLHLTMQRLGIVKDSETEIAPWTINCMKHLICLSIVDISSSSDWNLCHQLMMKNFPWRFFSTNDSCWVLFNLYLKGNFEL